MAQWKERMHLFNMLRTCGPPGNFIALARIQCIASLSGSADSKMMPHSNQRPLIVCRIVACPP
ncbi:hypothetical protein OG21DRAFT_1514685 [Imleria badia]|nr:hypothetical protein OG21DRAFT_1514685 [Imleria badia]